MEQQLRVCVLGGLDLAVGGRPLVGLASAKARALLAYLAVTGTAHSRSALAGLLWSDLPEEAARTNLRLVLVKLRRALPHHLRVTRQSVALAAEQPVWVDAVELARLGGVADDPDALLGAVELCGGEFLAGVEVPGAPLFDEWVVAERAACRAVMLGVLERAVQLARERAGAATGIQVARRLLQLEPLHEEAHRALMWFLAHAGQRSAALAHYERCRSLLADELGAEPSPATLALREEILRAAGFAELGPPPSGVATAPPAAVSLPVPRELPRPPADFTGRTDELATLLGLLDLSALGDVGTPTTRSGRPVVISAIDGMGGIGKSALAIQVANQLADHFPDGQLYVNLHGATPGLAPLDPLEALGRLLRALGLDPAQVPAAVEEAAARFRSLAAGRRLLMLLDNARDAEQVRPLLPASRTCGVLITSRQALTTLEGVRAAHLDVLPAEQALALLGRIAGPDRIATDPRPAAEVVRCCGRLPLALRIAGARLAARPGWPVRVLASRLADATHRLDELAAGDLAVGASLQVSLHTLQQSPDPLDQAAAASFGLLSLPDGPDLGPAAAARLLDQPEPATRPLLERLVDAHLLEAPQPDRYQFHDLVRLYARQHASSQQPEPVRLAALGRLVGFYTATAWQTQALLRPGDQRAATTQPQWRHGGRQFPDMVAALAWLETERANLLAAIGQAAAATPKIPAALVGQLTRALFGFFLARGYWQDGVQANQTVLELARRIQDQAAQGHALIDLGGIYRRLGRYHQAVACPQEALAIFRELGERDSQAASLTNLGAAHAWLRQHDQAIACLKESLTIYRDLGDRHGQAHSLSNLGIAYERLGQHDQALACLQDSLTIRRELGARHGQANSLTSLGEVYRRLGRYHQALACLQEGLTIYRELGDRHGQAISLTYLGAVDERLGRYHQAVARLQEGLAIFRELASPYGQAEALRHLGDTLRALARHEQARSAWQEALAICEALRLPEADEIRTRLAALPSEDPEPANSP
jgi:DNA-binding SARP family transcriptional activator/tetratricopeptide (TPR) repeat protein